MESVQYNESCCSNKKRSSRGLFIMLGILVLVVVSAAWHLNRWSAIQPDKDLYQSVLLSNDQLYFGKLHNIGCQYPYLTDVYYLQPSPAAVTADGQVVNGKGSYTVIKRGLNELHAPTDTLYLNSKEIVYWENVGADSRVAQGIKTEKEYRATGKAPEGIPVIDTTPAAPSPAVAPTESTTNTPATTGAIAPATEAKPTK